MNYQYLDVELQKWYNQYKYIADKKDLQYFIFRKDESATEKEIAFIENQLQTALPLSFKQFFLNYSKYLHFKTNLSEEICNSLPPELNEIFSTELLLSLTALIENKKYYAGWLKNCFNNVDDEYDRVWHNKLPFIHVPNGDYIAFDLSDDKKEKQVVYLSHDDGDGHGYILGKTFSNFLKNYIDIGCCGSEVWQMLPFIKDKHSGIDATCENAKKYRAFINSSV